MNDRLTWDQYWLPIATAISGRADCRRRRVGAVLVSEDHLIVAHGYNGTRPGVDGCWAGACPRGLLTYDEVTANSDYSNCISTHAELNALLHAPRNVSGLTMYITDQPCPNCEKSLYNAGLGRVVWPQGELDWENDASA